ncbi:MAG: AAA family ATPase [Goleter apudmare HA4340-LM2]|jgi:predicted ATPase/signal transduction histidine kinase|nr:AAA family ATPase [Goleter apudmare HA4340-LM2]
MNIPVDATAVLAGYQLIEQLYTGSRTAVYRGMRSADQQAVVIKLLNREYPTFYELLQFRNQYTITKNLNIPGIVRPYSLETYRHGYALVMEDFGGISLRDYIQTHPPALTEFLEIGLQLADILNYLYHHQIIHKDIKPANILIHPDTKQVKIIDFSIASLLPKETQEIKNPNVLEGTLAYLAPEQTGRMNRGIDYRADFYALGVTFFEVLTGEVPFQSDDPMELVHCHIAKMPTALGNRKAIPQVISDIVMKLMAKNAEDRYQSALGIKYDLEICLHQLKGTGKVKDFEIAQRDVCDRFLIPEKLYGREAEVQQLLAAFERVAQGNNELMLVAGFSGIGKTAVVNEVHKPIVKQRGYFIKGKFDQFNRNIPFSAFVQAFRDFMMQLFTESDQQLQKWQLKILEAVGGNGQVIIEVIPELERIIGQQPPVAKLSGNEARNRFNLLFQKFIQVFTTEDHPLVIFLDDLQWADSASLKLLQLLINETDNYLLLIGSYRDNEVSPLHPLILTLENISKTGAVVNTITLQPLSQWKLSQLVIDTLKCSENPALPLAQLVYQKTEGNPFFATQFLKGLYQDRLIQFNFTERCWQCDITQVNQQALTDDVVTFMAFQLRRLPRSTQEILQLAACIGNQFDLTTLAIVAEESELETAALLWKALQEGLILPQTEVYKFFQDGGGLDNTKNWELETGQSSLYPTYKFLHDRVQQAAYSLIPEDQRKTTHLKIGQLLLKNTSLLEQEEKIFEIVNQLNFGIDLITNQLERNQLVQLNLIAGQKAKLSTAYETAIRYLNTGLEMLAVDSWQSQYDLTIKIYIETIEAEYLNINFERSNQLIEIALSNTKNILEQVKIYEAKMQIYIAQLEMLKAIETGLQVLEKLDVHLVDLINDESLIVELPNLDDLENFLVMTDPYKLSAMQIIKILCAPVFMAKPEIFPQIIITMVNLCIEHGNSALSAFAYGFYGLLMSGIGKLNAGYHAGNIALKLLDKFDAKELKAKVFNLYNSNIRNWKEHTRNSIKPLQEGVQSGLETGDIEWGGYSAANLCSYLFFCTDNLESVVQQQAIYVDICIKIKQEIPMHFSQIWRQLGLNLQGLSPDKNLLIGDSFDEAEKLPCLITAKSGTVLFIFYVAKTILLYQFGDYAQALKVVDLANEQAGSAFGFMQVIILNFYHSLALSAHYLQVEVSEQQKYLEQIKANQEKMQFWVDHAPMNNQHRYDLVEAEKARILGKSWEAADLYDCAIKGAKENGYIQEKAIANELAAKFYLGWGKEKVAQAYMQEAYYCYARWGAKAKTDNLETRYPQLVQAILQQQKPSFNPLETIAAITSTSTQKILHTSSSGSTSVSEALDFASVLKAAQIISSSIQLDELIASVTKIILENAGAKKCVLILLGESEWQVRAITSINSADNLTNAILVTKLLDDCSEVPVKLVQYVKRTLEPVVIDNCQTEVKGLIGDYMIQHQPKSALCTPILNQGHLVGILYLENSLTQGVFTSDRLTVVNFLCAQAAISLENAQLYQQAQQALQDLQQTQLKLVQSEKMSALGNLVAGVAHEMNNPLGFIASSLKQARPNIIDLTEHLQHYRHQFPDPGDQIMEHGEEIDIDYLLEDLPKMISSMQVACDRLKNISVSLRTFSRADLDYKVPCNLHEGIDSTILILKHRLKANENRPAIAVVKNYGDLPPIECFPGQLNQVFMNLLANAIDALEESNQGLSYQDIQAHPNHIIIRTYLQDNYVKICISDNGIGIKEAVKERIFDHLFTTKDVGKGTGLGLAIARQIVEETHKGKLSLNSVLYEGTEFIVEIPL